jgi:hypothetical protein
MTVRHISWPSIGQFREVVKTVQQKSRYKGKDENGDAIFDPFAKLPILNFEATTKIHGSNASCLRDAEGNMWAQSRENIITPEKDNAGFAMFVEANKERFANIFKTILDEATLLEFTKHTVAVFGEWCGGNIQKNVAVCELPKMFVIFGIAFVDDEGNKTYFPREIMEHILWDNVDEVAEEVPDFSGIYSIYDFPTYRIAIDFENPHDAQNPITQLVEKIEAECPVGKGFGIIGTGEGLVWRCTSEGFDDSGFWFKTKGEKHSKSKVKTLATVDVEKINSLKELAERCANKERLNQGLQQVFGINGEIDVKQTGDYIRWVMKDIAKECLEEIAVSGFSMKEISSPVSKLARDHLMQNLEFPK